MSTTRRNHYLVPVKAEYIDGRLNYKLLVPSYFYLFLVSDINLLDSRVTHGRKDIFGGV